MRAHSRRQAKRASTVAVARPQTAAAAGMAAAAAAKVAVVAGVGVVAGEDVVAGVGVVPGEDVVGRVAAEASVDREAAWYTVAEASDWLRGKSPSVSPSLANSLAVPAI